MVFGTLISKQFPFDVGDELIMQMQMPCLPKDDDSDKGQRKPPYRAPYQQDAAENALSRVWMDEPYIHIINRRAKKVQNCPAGKLGLGFPDAVSTVIHALEKVPVLKVDENGVLLEKTLGFTCVHHIGRLERTLGS